MSEETLSKQEVDYKEFMNMKLCDILASITFNMEEDGASEGDVGRIVFENNYYGFSITVVKKQD